MDIGIQMGWEALEDKLEERENPRRCEVTWSLTRLPKLDDPGVNRLFVSVGGAWQGYFVLKNEILWSPEDARCPYALIFDTRTWTEIRSVKTRRFRGFTYDTPKLEKIVPRNGSGSA